MASIESLSEGEWNSIIVLTSDLCIANAVPRIVRLLFLSVLSCVVLAFRDFSLLTTHFRGAYCIRPVYVSMAHVKNTFYADVFLAYIFSLRDRLLKNEV